MHYEQRRPRGLKAHALTRHRCHVIRESESCHIMSVLLSRPDTIKLHLKANDLSHPGCLRFFSMDQNPHALLAACVSTIFQQLYPEDGGQKVAPRVRSITLYLEEFDGIAYTKGSQIDEEFHKEVHLSTRYVASVSEDRWQHEVRGVLQHELVHALQFNGLSTCPGGLIEGIADYIRLHAKLDPPHWRRGAGDRWDQGYEVTAYFLDFVAASLSKPTLVRDLNATLATRRWEDGRLFRELLDGHSPEHMWSKYKDATGQSNGTAAPARPTHR